MDEPLPRSTRRRHHPAGRAAADWGQTGPRPSGGPSSSSPTPSTRVFADRVAVMRPTRPAQGLVDNFHGRAAMPRGLPEFQALTQHIWSLIRDEAYRATVV
jgi:hypothetical protein